jgi:Lrp/AsnC family transcriptional regulator, leucine-responsive regulatory protein
MMQVDLDATDLALLKLLQHRGRIHNTELADELNLNPSTCQRRLKRLEESGIIDQYVMLLNAEKVGINSTVYVSIKLRDQMHKTVHHFEQEIFKLPEVLECHLVLGQTDYMLKVAVRDLVHYREFMLQHLTQIPGVTQIESMISLKRVKLTTALPI